MAIIDGMLQELDQRAGADGKTDFELAEQLVREKLPRLRG